MLLHPRTHLLVGSTVVFFLCWQLAITAPTPGRMSGTHAAVHELTTPDGCVTCHDPAGLATGCLSCHAEIKEQLDRGQGYHASLMSADDPTCGDCHAEHHGADFALTSVLSWGGQVEAAFRHPHTDFSLIGRHRALECAECHVDFRSEPFRLPEFPDQLREKTYLGLTQNCSHCHEDPHAGGIVQDCGSCHGQDGFHPPEFFDHAEHFPLAGGHVDLTCDQCHRFPSDRGAIAQRSFPFPFDDTKGQKCQDCHGSPHQFVFEDSCETCHPVDDAHWLNGISAMTAERHAQVGFSLDGPHAEVPCAECHPPHLPFNRRHPDPSAADYRRREDTCDGCHEDAHDGQFVGRYGECLDCHQPHRFQPSTFGHDSHAKAFELLGAHRGVACSDCHTSHPETGVRQFAGVTHECRQCHDDVHAGQFADEVAAGDCTSCHRSECDTFGIRPFDHAAQTGVTLEGAHARADCAQCHVRVPYPSPTGEGEVLAQRFVDTPSECAACHEDIHRGQFDEYAGCEVCHTSKEAWSAVEFDHNQQSRFKLEGAHAKVLCSSCHLPTPLAGGGEIVQYKPLSRECRSCHEIEPPRSR